MKIVSKIFNGIQNFIYRIALPKDDYYYYNLFVRNPAWNSTELNADESRRWSAIEALINFPDLDQRNLDILEVGSGRGWLSDLLVKYGNVQGVEPVSIVVKHARKLYPSLNFFDGTVPEYSKKYPDKKFDLIVLSEVIEHVPDNEKRDFVEHLCRALKDESFILVTTPRKEIIQALNYDPNQPIEDWLTESDLLELFTSKSLKEINRVRVNINIKGKDLEVYQVWLFKKI